jgi:rhodanese-related sulfurtransferase
VTAPELSAAEVAAALGRGEITAVDVREAGEWDAGHIAGAVWIPMGELPDRLNELPGGPLAIVCRSGSRSGMVADWLVRSGVDASNMAGGMVAWQIASLPIEPPDGFVA